MPFSQQDFLGVFVAYNTAIWPAQIFAYGAGIFILFALFIIRPGHLGRWILAVLAIFWAINGIAYHGIFFSRINPLAYVFAGFFLITAFCFLLEGSILNRVRFAFTGGSPYTWIGLGVMLYALAGYPLTNYLAGHTYSAMPTFGLTPCPTTKLTWARSFSQRRQTSGTLR